MAVAGDNDEPKQSSNQQSAPSSSSSSTFMRERIKHNTNQVNDPSESNHENSGEETPTRSRSPTTGNNKTSNNITTSDTKTTNTNQKQLITPNLTALTSIKKDCKLPEISPRSDTSNGSNKSGSVGSGAPSPSKSTSSRRSRMMQSTYLRKVCPTRASMIDDSDIEGASDGNIFIYNPVSMQIQLLNWLQIVRVYYLNQHLMVFGGVLCAAWLVITAPQNMMGSSSSSSSTSTSNSNDNLTWLKMIIPESLLRHDIIDSFANAFSSDSIPDPSSETLLTAFIHLIFQILRYLYTLGWFRLSALLSVVFITWWMGPSYRASVYCVDFEVADRLDENWKLSRDDIMTIMRGMGHENEVEAVESSCASTDVPASISNSNSSSTKTSKESSGTVEQNESSKDTASVKPASSLVLGNTESTLSSTKPVVSALNGPHNPKYSQQSIDFMERILQNSGIGNETHWPPWTTQCLKGMPQCTFYLLFVWKFEIIRTSCFVFLKPNQFQNLSHSRS